MTRAVTDDFDHPFVPDGHPLKRHVLYRLQSCNGEIARGRFRGRSGFNSGSAKS